jgi:hypothetical protein
MFERIRSKRISYGAGVALFSRRPGNNDDAISLFSIVNRFKVSDEAGRASGNAIMD